MRKIEDQKSKQIPYLWVWLFIGLLIFAYKAGEAVGAFAYHLGI